MHAREHCATEALECFALRQLETPCQLDSLDSIYERVGSMFLVICAQVRL